MEGLLFKESIRFAKNILDGLSTSEILEEIRQYTSTNYRANQIFSCIDKRIKNISLDLIEVIAEDNLNSRLAILLSVMKTNQRIYDLINNLFLPRMCISSVCLEDSDIEKQLIILGMDVKLPKIKLILAEACLILPDTIDTSIILRESLDKLFKLLCKEEWK